MSIFGNASVPYSHLIQQAGASSPTLSTLPAPPCPSPCPLIDTHDAGAQRNVGDRRRMVLECRCAMDRNSEPSSADASSCSERMAQRRCAEHIRHICHSQRQAYAQKLRPRCSALRICMHTLRLSGTVTICALAPPPLLSSSSVQRGDEHDRVSVVQNVFQPVLQLPVAVVDQHQNAGPTKHRTQTRAAPSETAAPRQPLPTHELLCSTSTRWVLSLCA